MSRLFYAKHNAFWLFILFSILAVSAPAQTTTAFTYQGRLVDSTLPQPTGGSYEMQYKLFDTGQVGAGLQIGATQIVGNVSVAGGIFTVQLDFGGAASFRGTDVFLEIGVRPVGSANAFTILAPRQQITVAPLAIRSAVSNQANNAANADALGGFPASNFVQTTDVRLSDDRNPLSGSTNYIQNQGANSQAASLNISGDAIIGGNISGSGVSITNLNAGNITTGTLQLTRGGTGLTAAGNSGNFLRSSGTIWTSSPLSSSDIPTGSGNYIQNSALQQPTSNFNVSGGGTVGGLFSANVVNSTTNFRIGGVIVFGTPGLANTFVGTGTGGFNTGTSNSFFGTSAGFSNTDGVDNSFFGSTAGLNNVSGDKNSFFGVLAGGNNISGINNSFFGFHTGRLITNGDSNSFFGVQSGENLTSGSGNTLIGFTAAHSLINATNTTAVGAETFPLGSAVTVVGYKSGSAAGVTNSTAIGANAFVSTSNTVVLGTVLTTTENPGLFKVLTLGAAGNTSLCRNALNQISTCTAGNFTNPDNQQNNESLAALREQNLQMLEQLKAQQIEIEALKTIVCAANPAAKLCVK